MKIIEWFKNLLAKLGKKDYMLNEQNPEIIEKPKNTDFVQKVDVDSVELPKSREDILRDLRADIMVEDLSEEYNYDKFSPDNVRKNYDVEAILSEEDLIALSCLYGAIKDGNTVELRCSSNKINDFLRDNPNNIVVLIDLMIKDAKALYEAVLSDPKYENYQFKPDSFQALIAGSYSDISMIIEEYQKESEMEVGE